MATVAAQGTFTEVGHLLAVAIGVAGYQVLGTPAGSGTSNALSVNETSV
jgi:hypothetical protein